MSRTLRTPGLPPTHGPVGYRWQNTGSFCSLINTRATSCRTSPVGVGAGVLPQWRRGVRPEASGGNMHSASDTPSSHSRRGWRSPRRRIAATAWRSRPRSGAYRGIKGCRQGASPSGGRSPRTDSRATRDTPEAMLHKKKAPVPQRRPELSVVVGVGPIGPATSRVRDGCLLNRLDLDNGRMGLSRRQFVIVDH